MQNNEDFYNACSSGNVKTVNALLLNIADERTINTGLIRACEAGHLQIVKLITSEKVIVLSTGFDYACRSGHFEIVHFFISKGANYWHLGLHSACISANLELVQFFASKGADSWHHGLFEACAAQRANLELVKFLVAKLVANGNDNVKQKALNYAIYGACLNGRLDILKFLISNGANNWNSSYREACNGRHLEIVKFLVSNGFGTASDRNHGLYMTYKNEDFEIIHLLLSCKDGANEIHEHYQWPQNKNQIMKLLYLKTPLSVFQRIDRFRELNICVVKTKQAILKANVLLPDLLNIVARCIIV